MLNELPERLPHPNPLPQAGEGTVRSGLTGLAQCLTTCLNGSLSRWERAGVRASARNSPKSGPSGRFSVHPLQMRQPRAARQ